MTLVMTFPAPLRRANMLVMMLFWVAAGEGDEGVRGAYALFLQDLGVRAVAEQHLSFGHNFLDYLAVFFVALYYLDAYPRANQIGAQIEGYAASAEHHNVPDGAFVGADCLEKGAHSRRRAHSVDDVAGPELKIAPGYRNLFSALHNGNQDAAAVLASEFLELQPAERRMLVHYMLDHLGAALGKGVHLCGAREAQYARDVRRSRLLRVENQGKSQFVLQEHHLAEILHRAHTGHRVGNSQLFAGEAAQQVHRVVVRNGYQQVGGPHLRLAEHAVIRAVAEQRHYVYTV